MRKIPTCVQSCNALVGEFIKNPKISIYSHFFDFFVGLFSFDDFWKFQSSYLTKICEFPAFSGLFSRYHFDWWWSEIDLSEDDLLVIFNFCLDPVFEMILRRISLFQFLAKPIMFDEFIYNIIVFYNKKSQLKLIIWFDSIESNSESI